ncbi:MAG: HAMP domain-containing sensor histidine kinase [Microgenomates group bacterium]
MQYAPLAIKTRAWIYILMYIGITLVISMSVLAGGYYWFSSRGMRSGLEGVAKEMVTNRLFFEEGEIKFRLDDEGRTLSAYLRDENMSAQILDGGNEAVAKYGIFQNEAEVASYNWNSQETQYANFVGKSGEKYMILSVPILDEGKQVGELILASPMLIFGHFGEIAGWLILTILVLSMLLSWPLSHQLVGIVFRSLDDVVEAMEKVGIENLGDKIDYVGNENDEVGILVRAYNRLLDRLADGLEKQKSFISNASHELKTPLARVVSTLEVLKLDTNDEIQRKKINSTKDELMQLSRRVDELLLLSRYDRNEVKIVRENFSPKTVVDLICKEQEIKIAEMNLKCLNEIEPTVLIKCDKVGFELAMANLISNAIKYNRRSGEIKISMNRINSEYIFEVCDQGEGIDKKIFSKVFERFTRGEKHQSRVLGFGVGMSLVKQICERNAWKIEYDKEYVGGTRVTLSVENMV